jgi:hypothetical protein
MLTHNLTAVPAAVSIAAHCWVFEYQRAKNVCLTIPKAGLPVHYTATEQL